MPMSGRDRFHRRQRLLAGLLLVAGMALAWMSVTPTGALSCLHCFLAQRWVEATVVDQSPRPSRSDTQAASVSHASRRVDLDPPVLSDSAVVDPRTLPVSRGASLSDLHPATERHWVFPERYVFAPVHTGPSQFPVARAPKIVGLRAPPSLIIA